MSSPYIDSHAKQAFETAHAIETMDSLYVHRGYLQLDHSYF